MNEPFNPYEPPVVASPPVEAAEPVQFLLASGNRRFLNHILDSIAVYTLIIFLIVVILVAERLMGSNQIELFLERTEYYPMMLLFLGYYAFFEGFWQRTPAKWITGTKVVRLDGRPMTVGDAIARTLIRLVPFEALSFLGRQSVGWHDRWTKTRVVFVRRPPV